MILKQRLWCVGAAVLLASSALQAQNQPSADEVLRFVRNGYTQYDRDFQGALRSGMKRVDFVLSLKPDAIRFIFNDPAQIVFLDTRSKNFALFEGVGGAKLSSVPASRYSETIRGTDVTYDDLSMRFLYWPNGKILRSEKIKARESWVVRVPNPGGHGSYGVVDIWIDKENGGMLRMVGYNRQGQHIRTFEVLHAKKFDNSWMVDDMRIDTIQPGSRNAKSSTRMQIRSVVR